MDTAFTTIESDAEDLVINLTLTTFDITNITTDLNVTLQISGT